MIKKGLQIKIVIIVREETADWSTELHEILPGVQIIGGQRAVYLPDSNTVVCSDIHAGMEHVLASNGVFVPVSQREELINRFRFIQTVVNAEHLVVNGDFKHSFVANSKGELHEVYETMNELQELFPEITIVKGNHDNFLSYVTRDFPKVQLIKKELRLEESVRILHGHQQLDIDNSKNDDIVFIGHEHPMLHYPGAYVGMARNPKFACFLQSPLVNEQKLVAPANKDLGNMLVFPSFTKLSGGSNILKQRKKTMLSPVCRKYMDFKELQPIVVDEKIGSLSFPKISAW